ncbi:hypothetical protein SAMN05443634_108161 [Chishuiella changwenlii]|uniref:Lipocalin-like domain-containing protein n=1 Tax=Chishuiella changwenlii TaxID=1434701 RepID=A0A1M7A407_9FLAO|nr:hypothetical protein [Chishuiella changwenlii]GGE91698.1 hypothetical protein GCM10010984_06720 [Chishuiella changwenlii]SHL37447.1 hypothetical protein SAMN05443634_108161 [Chishuiella changwenlii]
MKYFSYFLIAIFFSSCASNDIRTIKGSWKQEFISYKSNPTIILAPNDEPLIDIAKKRSKLLIEFNFNDGYDNDKTDSIEFQFPQLKFKKINLDKQANYYDLVYHQSCDCFLGEMESFSGNILNIKLTRILVHK